MSADHQQRLARLRQHGQEHLLAFWDGLAPAERDKLARQIDTVDFEALERLIRDEQAGEDWGALADRAQSPPAIRLRGENPISAQDARQRGEEALRAGHLGVVIVAGGQGTRLGFDQPKGMFPIGPVSEASLFQIFFEAVAAVGRRYGTRLPVYVMTSPATDAETRGFFAENDRFGLPEEEVKIFCQGTMPAVDASSGRLLLESKSSLALSPDGHGGMVAALERSGNLADVERRGLKQLFYMQVDNPLVRICDPVFIGYHLLSGSELSTLVVEKQEPLERVGNLVEVDGRVRIIEYSDLPDEAAGRKDARGRLALWAGSIAVHTIDVALLARVAKRPDALPFHRALKKVSFVDAQGRAVEPDEPNAIKFERFVFDLLPLARRGLAVEIDPSQGFAPLKNASGEKADTPETVRAAMIALHTGWLRQAGVEVAAGAAVEISPRFALDADELRERVSPGERVTKLRYFC